MSKYLTEEKKKELSKESYKGAIDQKIKHYCGKIRDSSQIIYDNPNQRESEIIELEEKVSILEELIQEYKQLRM